MSSVIFPRDSKRGKHARRQNRLPREQATPREEILYVTLIHSAVHNTVEVSRKPIWFKVFNFQDRIESFQSRHFMTKKAYLLLLSFQAQKLSGIPLAFKNQKVVQNGDPSSSLISKNNGSTDTFVKRAPLDCSTVLLLFYFLNLILRLFFLFYFHQVEEQESSSVAVRSCHATGFRKRWGENNVTF